MNTVDGKKKCVAIYFIYIYLCGGNIHWSTAPSVCNAPVRRTVQLDADANLTKWNIFCQQRPSGLLVFRFLQISNSARMRLMRFRQNGSWQIRFKERRAKRGRRRRRASSNKRVFDGCALLESAIRPLIRAGRHRDETGRRVGTDVARRPRLSSTSSEFPRELVYRRACIRDSTARDD